MDHRTFIESHKILHMQTSCCLSQKVSLGHLGMADSAKSVKSRSNASEFHCRYSFKIRTDSEI